MAGCPGAGYGPHPKDPVRAKKVERSLNEEVAARTMQRLWTYRQCNVPGPRGGGSEWR